MGTGYELSFAVVDVDCKGDNSGTVTVNSTGCDCFFSGCVFEWSDGQTFHTAENLPAGEYTVVVTHPNGCILEESVIVEENDSFIEDVIAYPITCNGEKNAKIEIVQAELTGALDIVWSTGEIDEHVLDNLPPGMYEFSATNYLGCVETYSFEIEEPTPLAFETEAKMSCEGMDNGQIIITPNGGTEPYIVFLNSDLPSTELSLGDLAPGSHNILLVDGNNCETSKTIEIEEEILASPDVQMESDEICAGGTVQLQAFMEDMDCTYSWSPTEGIDDPESAMVEASPEETTTYTVVATSPSGCQSSQEVTISVQACTSGISDEVNGLSVYPNPSNGIFNLRYEDSLKEVSVYDVVGRQIQVIRPELNQEKVEFIDIEDQIEGIYFLVLINTDGNQRTVKLTKE